MFFTEPLLFGFRGSLRALGTARPRGGLRASVVQASYGEGLDRMHQIVTGLGEPSLPKPASELLLIEGNSTPVTLTSIVELGRSYLRRNYKCGCLKP
jgi:hypothetical protein